MKATHVTLATVAKRAGVSIATVSKVLNGHKEVAEATRHTVEQALNETGYTCRTTYRFNRSRPSILIVLGNSLTVDAYTAAILDGALTEAERQEVAVTLARVPTPRAISPIQLAQEVVAGGHEGAVVLTPFFSDSDLLYLKRRNITVVMIDPVDVSHGEGVSVGATNWNGGLVGTRYLIAQGHRKIGYISGPYDRLTARARLHGYTAALDMAEIPFDERLVRYGPFRTEAGESLGGELLDLADPPTAIFASSDAAAIGAMSAARTRSLRIPEDVSIVGFDDTYIAKFAVPPLTTVRQPLAEMGAEGIRALILQAKGNKSVVRRIELNTELIIRSSVAQPRITNQ